MVISKNGLDGRRRFLRRMVKSTASLIPVVVVGCGNNKKPPQPMPSKLQKKIPPRPPDKK